MECFITALLTSSISMSVIALLYIAVETILAKKYSAKSIYYGWLIIILGFIIPFRPQFSKSLIQINSPKYYNTNIPVVNNEINYTTNKIVENTNVITNSFQVQWFQVAFLIWLAGLILFMSYFIYRHNRFKKMINRWNEDIKSIKILNLLEQLKSEMKITNEITIKMCHCISTPMLIGFYEPKILLPPNNLSDKEISLILRHELIHYKQKDLLYKALMIIVIVMHWFNPIVYLIAKIINRQCEVFCDEEVSKFLDINGRKLYAGIILNASKKQNKYQSVLSTNFCGGKDSMKKRIVSIMNIKKKKLGLFIFCFIIIATMSSGKVLATNNTDISKTEQIKLNLQEQKRIEEIKQDCAIYEKYGLTYNEEEDKFYYNEKTVKCFFDIDYKKSYYFIIRPSGEINIKAIRNKQNDLVEIKVISDEEADSVSGKFFGIGKNKTEENKQTLQENKAIINNNENDDSKVEKNKKVNDKEDKKKEDKKKYKDMNVAKGDYSIYEKYGLTYDKYHDMFYYNETPVKIFLDKYGENNYFFTTRQKEGKVDIKAVRDEEYKLIGIEYLSKEEYDSLFKPTNKAN